MANHDAMSETNFRYDVFLSFRGKDTRHTFTCDLYEALRLKGIVTFIDNEELRVGEQIRPALLEAIEESRISIIVFSETYATSTWCLDELSKIIGCQEEKNQTVIPIFYEVEPSDVRYQINSYGQAMTKHETRFGNDSKKVREWRSALVKASGFSGRQFRERNKSEFIKDIVSEVSRKVSPKPLHLNEHIVGMEYQVEKLKSLLDMESDSTICLLGIYGAGGIGKTTLAKVLYNSICNQFESACFLPNIRETYNQYEGQKLLLQSLLSNMLGEAKIQLTSVDEGIKTIKRRLSRKRVLIILDDVDNIEQLKILAGGRDWFGSGSRIIIATRDKHLLDLHEVKKVYEMALLKDFDSLELFCRHAFKMSHPAPNYEDLSDRAVCCAKGLPQALKEVGSHLFMKGLREWESALDKYGKSLHERVFATIKISYDSLDRIQKGAFLDIACFFKGQRLEYVKTILEACDFYPYDTIKVLVDKCLIKVQDDYLRMLDSIQDTGREIVKREAPEAGNRSRLWFNEDVLEVLTQDTGSIKIEGVMLEPPQRGKIEWIDCAFKKMNKLRILIVQNASFSSAPSYLPNQLRLLDWKEYPSQSFPPGFCPKKIVALNVSWSNFVSLPASINKFACLASLDVSYCVKLENIPELPSCVQAVNARHCDSLSAETSSMLWSQVRKEIKRLEVIMPKTEIPEWFDYRKEGGIPVFRCRGKFPVIALAFVFNEPKVKGPLPIHRRPVGMHLLIEEGQDLRCAKYHTFMVADNHVLLCDLRVLFNHVEWEGHQHNNDWKTVQVVCETDLILSSWGIYVYEKETKMDDIEFTTTYHPSYSIDQSEGNLSNVEEEEAAAAAGPSHVLGYDKGRHHPFTEEEGGGSGFDLEDEDVKEDDSMLQWIPGNVKGKRRRRRRRSI